MGARGRKSRAELSVITNLEVVRRPKPPAELTDEQAIVWQAVVDANDADHFAADTEPLLVRYCQHIVTGRRIEQLKRSVEDAKELDVNQYDQLTRMAERESRIIASLAVKLRLSQSATDDRRKRKPPPTIKKPWET